MLKNFYGFKNMRLLDSIEGNNAELISSILGKNEPDSATRTFDVIILRGLELSATESFLKTYLAEIKENGLAFVINIPVNKEEKKASLDKSMNLYLPAKSINYPVVNDISQCLDIKPSILHYLNLRSDFISYGSSLFSNEKKLIFTSNGSTSYYLMKDSLLLNFSDEETKSLLLLKGQHFLKADFKDSLAVEKIDLENHMHSIFQDFENRIENNRLE